MGKHLNYLWFIWSVSVWMLGCGLAEIDICPDDPNKDEPGLCGCGVEDSAENIRRWGCDIVQGDKCPYDDKKNEPGLCGCGMEDTPDNIDRWACGTLSKQEDKCPKDLGKTEPGLCGCGYVDDDSDRDGDGTADCIDGCPDDPKKLEAGRCGCGIADTKENIEKYRCDIPDACPDNPDKVEPGKCGCEIEDSEDNLADYDEDGVINCLDKCPGIIDLPENTIDTDGDGILDCLDQCPKDRYKIVPGLCGCGLADTTENIETYQCVDKCPDDPAKIDPGICGCGKEDSEDNLRDYDGDNFVNCVDACPDNPTKWLIDHTARENHGCEVLDSDRDGLDDEADPCPTNPDRERTGSDCDDKADGIYTIRYALDLELIREEIKNGPAKEFQLEIVNDINMADLKGVQWSSDGCSISFNSLAVNDSSSIQVKGIKKKDGSYPKIYAIYQNGTRCTLSNAMFDEVRDARFENLNLDLDISNGRSMLVNTVHGSSDFSSIQYQGTIITDTDQAVGGLIGKASGTVEADVHVTDCYAKGISIEAQNASAVGGLIGEGNDVLYQSRFSHEIQYIIGKDYVGGVMGKMTFDADDAGEKVLNNYTKDEIAYEMPSVVIDKISGNDCVGGFAGYVKVTSYITFEHLNNYINLIEGHDYVGGVFGNFETINESYTSSTIMQLITNNVQTLKGSGSYIGGFMGNYRYAIDDIKGDFFRIYNLSNSVGSIQLSSGNSKNVGGFIGSVLIHSLFQTVKNEIGEIVETTRGAQGDGQNIGGMIGEGNIVRLHWIDHSVGKMEIPDFDNVGGMVGLISYITIKNSQSFVDGDLIGHDKVGGIVGLIDDNEDSSSTPSDFRILNVDNGNNKGGRLSGNRYVGGLVGLIKKGSTIKFVTLYNYFLSGTSNVGGVFGGVELNKSILGSGKRIYDWFKLVIVSYDEGKGFPTITYSLPTSNPSNESLRYVYWYDNGDQEVKAVTEKCEFCDSKNTRCLYSYISNKCNAEKSGCLSANVLKVSYEDFYPIDCTLDFSGESGLDERSLYGYCKDLRYENGTVNDRNCISFYAFR